jgi:crossover junction endodeoxyribonuclease RuvC
MIILGIDPGTLVTGYGVIETANGRGSRMEVIEYGTIESKRISTLPLRLKTIFTRLSAVIERAAPDELAIESAFYHKNAQSTLKIGHARGVAILAGTLRELPAAEYAPREIKRAVAGTGNASKQQVEYMVRRMLRLAEEDQKLPDAYDALAVAITHAARCSNGTGSIVAASTGAITPKKNRAKSWKQFVEDHPERIKKNR